MVSVILLAAWNSDRFWTDKLKTPLWWVPIFLHSLAKFHKNPNVDEIIVVCKKEKISEYELLKKSFPKIKKIVLWWNLRQISVLNWINEVDGEICLIHNWANPWVTTDEINSVIEWTQKYWACVVLSKTVNTIKIIWDDSFISKTTDREKIVEVQTPQWVNTKKFLELSEKYKNEAFTDDVSVFEKAGEKVKLVKASETNFKITTPMDLAKAEGLVKPSLRIWIWHDSHRFIKKTWENFITLWTVKIKHSHSFEANSDWDVVLHCLCNWIWTAIWEGSLSLYSDEMCKKWVIDSRKYLKHIFEKCKSMWYVIWNISISIEWSEPKLEKHIPEMKEAIGNILNCSPYQIWIAVTSWEKLSDFWKWNGIQAFCNIIAKRVT